MGDLYRLDLQLGEGEALAGGRKALRDAAALGRGLAGASQERRCRPSSAGFEQEEDEDDEEEHEEDEGGDEQSTLEAELNASMALYYRCVAH